MIPATWTLQVWPGAGTVARIGDTVLLIGPEVSPDGRTRLLDAARNTTGAALTRSLAEISVSEAAVGLETVAAISPEGDGLAILLRGRVELRLVRDGSRETVRGTDASTWVERVVPGPLEALAMSLVGAQLPEPAPWLNLREGVVLGAGASLEPAPAIEAADDKVVSAPGPAAGRVTAVEFESIDLRPDPSVIADREPLAVEPAASSPPPDESGHDQPAPVMVKGYRCPRDHHNRPDAAYCCICGIKMGVHRTVILMDGPRPPLGVLALDDGTTFAVRRDMVLGREPEQHRLVLEGAAASAPVVDDTHSISRAHLHVTLQEWSVLVVDLGSSNGTLICSAGSDQWQPVPPGRPERIGTGTRIRLGDRELIFDQHHVR